MNFMEEQAKYDFVNPEHYKGYSIETVEMMIRVWGKETVALFAEMSVFKYRMRMGKKPGEPIEREMEKIRWWETKAKELRNPKKFNQKEFDKEVEEFIEITKLNNEKVNDKKVQIEDEVKYRKDGKRLGVAKIKVCKKCNKEFKPTANSQQICLNCKPNEKGFKKVKICKDCGTEFVITDRKENNRKFCDLHLAATKTYQKIMPETKHGVKEKMTCIDCKKEFKPTSNVQKRCTVCRVNHNKKYRADYKRDLAENEIPVANTRQQETTEPEYLQNLNTSDIIKEIHANKVQCPECIQWFEQSREGQKYCNSCEEFRLSMEKSID